MSSKLGIKLSREVFAKAHKGLYWVEKVLIFDKVRCTTVCYKTQFN